MELPSCHLRTPNFEQTSISRWYTILQTLLSQSTLPLDCHMFQHTICDHYISQLLLEALSYSLSLSPSSEQSDLLNDQDRFFFINYGDRHPHFSIVECRANHYIIMHRDYDYELKICLVGETQVGKTSLIERYADNCFDQNTQTTIGVDFKFKSFNFKGNFVKLQLWDTAGQQKFRSVIDKYYRDADAIIMVYDSTEVLTFDAIDKFWVSEVKKRAKTDCLLSVFANKCENQRDMSLDEKEWCKRQKIMGFEVSAKTGDGVRQAIEEIVDRLLKIKPKMEREKIIMTLNEQSFAKPKNKCCK